MASPREHARRDARLRELAAKAVLSPAERRELGQLEAWRDGVWKRLPGRIERLRHTLRTLEAQADDLGLGPC